MSKFADVILPLPLYGTYTYSIPDYIQPAPAVGSRVFVQFGARKFYTAIVVATHDAPPPYEVKPITAVFEPEPITRYPQLKLWQWISDYYLCAPGDVFKAAVPSALKVESETTVCLREDWDAEQMQLSETEAKIVAQLSGKGALRVSDIKAEVDIANVGPLLSKLMRKGVVAVAEKATERYTPKRTVMVRLNARRGDSERLHDIFGQITRSQKQERILITYLDLSGWLNPREDLRAVSKAELITRSGQTTGVLKGLIDKGILETYTVTSNRFAPLPGEWHDDANPTTLTNVQADARKEILKAWEKNTIVLLHGVTGSGKTEIYANLISETLSQGNQALYLVPEIGLTAQLANRLRKIFGDRLIVYHSKFSDSERADIWRRLLESHEPAVILGVRSSVFLPFARLGLVVVDEEHEASYKQYSPAPRYNARDVAMVLAGMHGAKVLLGSATPSVETYAKALDGKFGLVTLSERYEGVNLPEVDVVDMREQRKKKLVSHGIFSQPLASAVKEALSADRQVILFQNRRGFAPLVRCADCGWTPRCPDCDVSPVYHKLADRMTCHYCGFTTQLPHICPACGSAKIETYGFGTERIAEATQELCPDAHMERMDLDTTRNKESHSAIIDRFSTHKTDILVGTQMVSKGLDFAGVSTVGVVNADTLLNFPDFRASERAFNMLEQVSGRAGRRSNDGKVIIQTTSPDSKVLSCVREHDYTAFFTTEIEERRKYNYPPFTRVIDIYLRHRDEGVLEVLAASYAAALREVFGSRVLGPETPPVGRIARYYQRRIMLKVESGSSMPKVKALLRKVYEKALSDRRFVSLKIDFDVDPV